MSSEDLVRARCDSADAAFLLADRFAMDADEQDSVTVLRAITMKSHMSPRNIYVQILLPENRRHLRMSGVPDANVLCVAQTKSVRCPNQSARRPAPGPPCILPCTPLTQ